MTLGREKELINTFGKDVSKPEVLKACLKLLEMFDINVDELYMNWEAFSYSKKKETENNDSSTVIELNIDALSDLQTHIMKNLEKKSKAGAALSSAKKTRRYTSSPMGSMFDILPSSPMSLSKRKLQLDGSTNERVRKNPRPSLLSSSPTKLGYDPDISMEIASPKLLDISQTAFDINDGTYTGDIAVTLNPQISVDEGLELGPLDNSKKSDILLASNFDAEKYKFRIMRQKLLEAADVLDDQIDSFAVYIAEANPQLGHIGNPNLVSQEDIIAVGRITPDSPLTTFDESINKESLCLEPSRASGIGQRVRLNLANVDNYCLFPGQIVALKGRNANGKSFTVNEIISTPLLGAATSTADELQLYRESLHDHKLKVVVTAGPYTTNDSLDFSHLSNLVERLNGEIKPQFVIMFGPFLDYSHPKVVDGSIEEAIENMTGFVSKPKTLDEVFKAVIVPILKKIHPQIQVILVPSTKDASSRHPSYPQDSFDRRLLGLPKNFKCFPNPASFQINECLFGTSNNDIYKDLKDVVVGAKALEMNRFDRITNYILEQRRYYPLFPAGISHQKVKLISPPPESIDYKISETEQQMSNGKTFEIQQVGGADLDIPYLGLSEFNDATPDLLILPSQLKYFARVVKNVIVINPGNFMKPKRNGTFAILNIEAPSIEGPGVNVTKVNGEENLYLHDIWKRCRVDIVNS